MDGWRGLPGGKVQQGGGVQRSLSERAGLCGAAGGVLWDPVCGWGGMVCLAGQRQTEEREDHHQTET